MTSTVTIKFKSKNTILISNGTNNNVAIDNKNSTHIDKS